MALARIISNSRECVRELAVNLLDRGYAVEIVSPEAIPDNFADLELRVESDIPAFLTGSAEVHNGERSTSLQFVHHLKTPMPHFNRRPPGSGAPAAFKTESAPFRESHVVASAEQKVAEKGEVPLSSRKAREVAAIPSVPVAPNAKQDVIEEVEVAPSAANAPAPSHIKPEILTAAADVTPSIMVPEQLPAAPQGTKEPSKFAIKIIIPKSKSASKRISRRGGWFWRAALTSFGVLMAALGLGLGTTRLGGTAALSNHDASGAAVVAGVDNQPSSLVVAPIAPMTNSPAPVPATSAIAPSSPARPATSAVVTSGKQEAKPAVLATAAAASPRNAAAATRAKVASAKSHHAKARRHVDDVVAPDTVTYFDEGAKPVRVERFTHHPATPAKHDGAVAASKTGVNDRTVP